MFKGVSMNAAPTITNALSFDIEDWFHMVEIDAVADPRKWDELPSLVERYTELIVNTLDEAKVKATFFMLGWVADRHPRIVKLIADRGHELGTHSFWHRKVYELKPDELRDDLRQ